MRVAVRDEIAPEQLGIAVAHAGIVLGSFRDSRAIPPTVFDALSTGAPVVTADTAPRASCSTDGESALLVRAGRPRRLADAVDAARRETTTLRTRVATTGNRVFRERASRRALGARWAELLAPLVVSHA